MEFHVDVRLDLERIHDAAGMTWEGSVSELDGEIVGKIKNCSSAYECAVSLCRIALDREEATKTVSGPPAEVIIVDEVVGAGETLAMKMLDSFEPVDSIDEEPDQSSEEDPSDGERDET